jgi:quercetin dioxygenase-like cupin family protein
VSDKVLIVDLNNKAEYQRLLGGLEKEPHTFGMCAGRAYIKPGQSCGRHSTDQREELLVFLSGKGKLLIGENESFDIGEGKVCYIPPQTIHNVENTGPKPLIYVYCVTEVSPVKKAAQPSPTGLRAGK